MSDETLSYAHTFGQIIDDLVATLTGLDDAALNAPIDLEEANTIAALATHTVAAGEFWTLVLVGGQRIPRDRPAEFRAVAGGPALIARLQAWRAALDALLPDLPEAALGPTPPPPAEYGFTPLRRGEPLTGRACLLHAIEHSAMHLGHLQLTRQLVLARSAGDAAGAPQTREQIMPLPFTADDLLEPLLRSAPMLATSLQAAWRWGDPPLRADLEASIHGLVHRAPALLPVFKTTVRSSQPPPRAGLDATAELCGLLMTIWALGDPPLRGEVAAMALSYGQRHPSFGPAFHLAAVTALGDPRLLDAAGDRTAALADLSRLIAQLAGA